MDWKTLRRDKLAKTASYKPREPKEGAWWGGINVAADLWERFMTLSWWEKSMIIGTAVLLAILAPLGVMALTGGDEGQAAVVATSTEAPIVVAAGPSDTPTPIPTNTPKAVPNTATPTNTPGANRENCEAIRGTSYLSDDERDWFQDNCDPVGPEPTDTPSPSGPGGPAATNTPVPAQPTNTAAPQPFISAGEAAALAADWVNSNPAYSELDITPSSCSPQQDGAGWRVGCTGTASGCVGSCQLTIWVCVTNSGIRQC